MLTSSIFFCARHGYLFHTHTRPSEQKPNAMVSFVMKLSFVAAVAMLLTVAREAEVPVGSMDPHSLPHAAALGEDQHVERDKSDEQRMQQHMREVEATKAKELRELRHRIHVQHILEHQRVDPDEAPLFTPDMRRRWMQSRRQLGACMGPFQSFKSMLLAAILLIPLAILLLTRF